MIGETMDVVVGIIVFFTAFVGLGEEIKKNDAELALANKRIEQLESDFFRLAGSHAAISARDLVNHEDQEKYIKSLQQQINILHE